jgi:hypothetical protein
LFSRFHGAPGYWAGYRTVSASRVPGKHSEGRLRRGGGRACAPLGIRLLSLPTLVSWMRPKVRLSTRTTIGACKEATAALAAIPEHACPAAKGRRRVRSTRRFESDNPPPRTDGAGPFSPTRAVTDIAVAALPTQKHRIHPAASTDRTTVSRIRHASPNNSADPESRVG